MPGPKENIERDRAYAYTLVCFLFLIVLRVALTSRGVGNWAWLPVVVGVASLALRWPTGPLAFLLAVVLLLFSHELGLDPYRLLYRVVLVTVGWVYGIEYRLPPMRSALPRVPSLLADLGLAVGVLGFCIGYYRLQGLLVRLFPVDRVRGKTPIPGQKKPGSKTVPLFFRPSAPEMELPIPTPGNDRGNPPDGAGPGGLYRDGGRALGVDPRAKAAAEFFSRGVAHDVAALGGGRRNGPGVRSAALLGLAAADA